MSIKKVDEMFDAIMVLEKKLESKKNECKELTEIRSQFEKHIQDEMDRFNALEDINNYFLGQYEKLVSEHHSVLQMSDGELFKFAKAVKAV